MFIYEYLFTYKTHEYDKQKRSQIFFYTFLSGDSISFLNVFVIVRIGWLLKSVLFLLHTLTCFV